jgi:hypothetical protein
MTLAIGWLHDGGDTVGTWLHDAGDWQAFHNWRDSSSFARRGAPLSTKVTLAGSRTRSRVQNPTPRNRTRALDTRYEAFVLEVQPMTN